MQTVGLSPAMAKPLMREFWAKKTDNEARKERKRKKKFIIIIIIIKTEQKK